DFVTPLTLSTLSKNPVHSVFYEKNEENELWNNHVDLGLWADYMVVAPATANTLSKMVHGIVDNLLLAVYLSAKCPVYFAPAMDLDMFKHASTTENIEKLEQGNHLIPAGTGELASGLVGEGRMAEPEEIVAFVENDILSKLPLKGQKVLITAGPTYEAIDPVRFIGNHSSGKMGFELALQAANLGATVYLIAGPCSLSIQHSAITRIDVTSAEEMFNSVFEYYTNVDIAIAAAAVADYTPVTTAQQKIKKKEGNLPIELKATKDILATMGASKNNQFLVGFALETNNEVENAKGKLSRKNLDMIVLNSLKDKGAAFGGDTNKISVIDASNKIVEYTLKSKEAVASDIFSEILKRADV
ncbi:MAG: bifunctional phosphopantothenoylcysteine decarboxylase/phosphopantothenate--cysteine ligase CoaBC, partial [Flavicella sp.]|nr:bifunctional phosphopantothenoylcysteine decarboxylase/phosphopantothenate--cysteine ligase CoaBC [Flavicella sp.]